MRTVTAASARPLARVVLGFVVLVAAMAASTLPSPADAASDPSSSAAGRTATPWPMRLSSVGDSRQVIVVTAGNWTTSRGRLQAWRLDAAGSWHQTIGPVPARLGWSGFQPAGTRRQGSGKTPAGTFRLLRGFGLVDPGKVTLPYRVVDGNDWWPYDPAHPRTYNVPQLRRPPHAPWRTTWAEHLASYRPEYRYAVVLDYNLPRGVTRLPSGVRVADQPADTRRGGGIFLHVNGAGPTAGCVSVAAPTMRHLLRWLDPAARPVIAMGPKDWLPGR